MVAFIIKPVNGCCQPEDSTAAGFANSLLDSVSPLEKFHEQNRNE